MLLSSCVVWRYHDLDAFRAECPGGDPELQRQVIERLDEGIAWLRSLGAEVVWEETGNERTVGVRFDPRSLTDVLVRAAGDVRLGTRAPDDAEQLLLATGGFQGNRALVREHIAPGGELLVRANHWSEGDGLRLALERGADLSSGMDEFYGRAMPAPPAAVPEERFVDLAQLYGRYALVLDDPVRSSRPNRSRGPRRISCRRSRAGRTRVPGTSSMRTRWASRSVAAQSGRWSRQRARREARCCCRTSSGSSFPDTYTYAVHVVAGITHTIGGLRIDPHARVLGADGAPIEGLYAAGADAGGISTGGYASGLASALVFGRIAAETAAQA